MCIMWALVAFRLICPFSIESALSLVPSGETVPEEIFVYEGERQHETAWIDAVDNPVYPQSVSVPTGNTVSTAQTRAVLFTLFWLAGMAALWLYALISCIRLRRGVRASIPAGERVFVCDEAESPFILGVFAPRIYLPSSMEGDTLDCVRAHERAHIRRGDHVWKPFGFLLLSVYWFAPLCWAAYLLLCRDIEAACDEAVIRRASDEDRSAYSKALLECSLPRRKVTVCPLAFGELGVKERVKLVLGYKKPTFWVMLAAAAACITAAVCFMTVPKEKEPDLSFLNYENAIASLADMPKATAIYYPPSDENGIIIIGCADGGKLAEYLDLVSWQEWSAPKEGLSSPGSIEFCIDEEYRITVYQKPRRVKVRYMDEVRYYKAHGGDYEKAAALFYAVPAGTYVCEQQGFGGRFTLNVYTDGAFDYYEGALSSYCGFGHWEYDGSVLTLHDEGLTDERIFTFSYDGEALCFDKPHSARFTYVDIPDGTKFVRGFKTEQSGRYYLTVGAEGVKSILISLPGTSGGCENADGSLYKKGDSLWLEPLDGCEDLRGLTVEAVNAAGKTVWSASIPDNAENCGFTYLAQDGWIIEPVR